MSERNPQIVDSSKAKQELDRMKESQRMQVHKALNKQIQASSRPSETTYRKSTNRYDSSNIDTDVDKYLKNKNNFAYVPKKSHRKLGTQFHSQIEFD